MKKIIEEIIENNPELEKDKDNLKKAANVLEKNNPKILPSKEFKKSLKSRLSGIIGLKQGNKSNFVFFAMPVFSLLFVVGGLLYYFDDINFFLNGDNIYNAEKLTEEEILDIELQEVMELFENNFKDEDNAIINVESIDNTEEIVPIKILPVNNKEVQRNIVEDSVNKTINTLEKDNENDISEADMNEYINDIFGTEAADSDDGADLQVEDNSILEIFEGLDMDLSEESEAMIYDEVDESMDDSVMIENDAIIETNFETFCENEGGKLTGTGNIQKCITNKKECFASEFKNGICEFVEIK